MDMRKASALAAVAVIAATGILLAATGTSANAQAAEPASSLAANASLLSGREGFGRSVTGGYSGPIVHVTNNADSGPGSLRAAVSGNAPAWVVFDGDYTIRLLSGIPVGSNKTVDGRGHKVVITGPGTDGLLINSVSNIIVENVVLTGFGDVTLTAQNNTPDAIHVCAARNVWIDHTDLSVAGDKLISIGCGSTGITVSWNRFHNQEQVFQIGDQQDAGIDAQQTVTVDHNLFDHTGYRNPVVSYGKAHVYNNYLVGWKNFGVRSQRLAQIYLENNVFRPEQNRKAAMVTTSGDGCNDSRTRCDDRPGYLNAVGNLLLGRATVNTSNPSAVFRPASYYPYRVDVATTQLASKIQAEAGATRS